MSPYIFIPVVIFIFALYKKMNMVEINDISNNLPTNGSWPFRSGEITDITLHHSASTDTQNAYDFARYHVNTKGWKGIAYHYVIDSDGTVNKTNADDRVTWHNGYNNENAIGICLVGNFENNEVTKAQEKSVLKLVSKLRKDHPTIYRLVGHGEYDGHTKCPGGKLDMKFFRMSLKMAGL